MNCVIFTLPLHAQKIENRCRKTGDRKGKIPFEGCFSPFPASLVLIVFDNKTQIVNEAFTISI